MLLQVLYSPEFLGTGTLSLERHPHSYPQRRCPVEQGLFRALSSLPSKIMGGNRRKDLDKIPQSTLREKVTGEGKTQRESVTRDSLPPPVLSASLL